MQCWCFLPNFPQQGRFWSMYSRCIRKLCYRRDCLATPLLDVDMGEATCLLHAMQWAKELNLVIMNFKTNSKVVVYSIYIGEGASDFVDIIYDRRHSLMIDLANSDVKFIRIQFNSVAHSLVRESLNHARRVIHFSYFFYDLYKQLMQF